MRIELGSLGLLLAFGCVDAAPCTTSCPKIEGSYAMTYKVAPVQSPDCVTLSAPLGPPTVEITRSGAEVRSTLYGAPGRGMLQDTNDFSIAATAVDGGSDGGTQTYILRGYFVPPIRRGADGGDPATITGKWITHGERGALICDSEQPYTGFKQ